MFNNDEDALVEREEGRLNHQVGMGQRRINHEVGTVEIEVANERDRIERSFVDAVHDTKAIELKLSNVLSSLGVLENQSEGNNMVDETTIQSSKRLCDEAARIIVSLRDNVISILHHRENSNSTVTECHETARKIDAKARELLELVRILQDSLEANRQEKFQRDAQNVLELCKALSLLTNSFPVVTSSRYAVSELRAQIEAIKVSSLPLDWKMSNK